MHSGALEPGADLKATFFWRPAQKVERDVEIAVDLYDLTRNVTVASKDGLAPARSLSRARLAP